MAKQSGSSSFVKALQRRAGKKWGNFKTAEDQFKPVDLPDGVYITKLSAVRCDIDKNGDPYVAFNFVVVDAKYEGQKPSKFHGIREQGKRTIEMAIEMLSTDFQRLGLDVSDLDIPDLPKLTASLDKSKPFVKIRFKNAEQANWSPDITIMGLAGQDDLDVAVPEEEDEIPFDDSEEEDDDDSEEESEDDDEVEEDEEDSEEDEDEEEEGEDDPDEILEPEKGDLVKYRKTVCKVVTVNRSKETCSLRSVKDTSKKFANVPWSEVVEAEI